MESEFPVLIADIGGTNARFGVVHEDGQLVPTSNFKNTDFPTLDAMMHQAIRSCGENEPVTAAMALACPIVGNTFRLTNFDGEIVPERILAGTGLKRMLVMNDFLAQAIAAISFNNDDVQQFGGKKRDPKALHLIVGPGTGLGVAIVLPVSGKFAIVPGEGGHADIGPRTQREFALWPYLESNQGRIEAEQVISGAGLKNLYSAIRKFAGKKANPTSSEEITRNAMNGGDPECLEAVELMTLLLARFSGDLAITTLPRGGIYFCGGLVKPLLPLLDSDVYRSEFSNKEPFRELMNDFPLYSVMHPCSGLFGIARYLLSPGDFLLADNVIEFS